MSSVPEPPPKRVEITISIVVRQLTAERRAAVALAHAATAPASGAPTPPEG